MANSRLMALVSSEILLLLAVAWPTTSCEPEAKNTVDEFSITATYFPGLGSAKSWKTSISEKGKVVQEAFYFNVKEKDRNFSPSRQDLLRLLTVVKEVNFFSLPRRSQCQLTDSETLVVKIKIDSKEHEVSVYCPSYLSEKDEVRRFLKVWSEILRIAPSPNPKQIPDEYYQKKPRRKDKNVPAVARP